MCDRLILMKRSGFTLIELVGVVTVIAVLISLLVPAVQKVREAAAQTQTHNHLMQLALALHAVNDATGQLPPPTGKFGRIDATLHVHLLPYVEQDNLYEQIVDGLPLPQQQEIGVPIYQCPQDPTSRSKPAGTQNYAANLRAFDKTGVAQGKAGLQKAFQPTGLGGSSIPDTFTDGTSNTISFATMYSNCGGAGPVFFTNSCVTGSSPFFGCLANNLPASFQNVPGQIFQNGPTDSNCNPDWTPQGYSIRGISVALFDGSVRVVYATISPATWAAACQPNDGIPLGADWEK
jgi:prepilin-type N-terminal cleavage/methylation domain-containing protein